MQSTPQKGTSENSIRERLRRFFYTEETPYGMALVRIFLPLALLCAMLPRWFKARELFSTDGAPAPLWVMYNWPDMLPEPSGTLAVILASLLVVTLITTALGWCTRMSVITAFVLYTYLNLLDAVGTMTKYSVIASHALLLLGFSQCGSVWSIDAWLKERRDRQRGITWFLRGRPKSPVWPQRLLQLLLGYVYFGAAVTKMHTPAYFSGDQLQTWMRTSVNYSHPLGEYLSLVPVVLVVFAYVAIVWEVLFIFLCWRGWGRIFMLTLGGLFHLMTTLALGLYIFPLVCFSLYFAFLYEDDVCRLAVWWKHRKKRWLPASLTRRKGHRPFPVAGWLEAVPLSSPAAFSLLLAATALLGVEAEYRLDPYGLRRPEGPYALQELDREFVENMVLKGPEPIRYKDMVRDFNVGTTVISGILAFPKREFRQGEILKAHCSLNPPHKDMFISCELKDAQGRVVTTRQMVVPREMWHPFFRIPLSDAIEPGRYTVVLKCAGVEVKKRTITIKAGRRRMAAN